MFMSQSKLPIEQVQVAVVYQLVTGALVIRPLPGRRLVLTPAARTRVLPNGDVVLEPLAREIEMMEAMQILGVPYSTLRRIIEAGAVKAWKRSPGRWVLDLASVLDLKDKATNDPEFWDGFRSSEGSVQEHLKL